ncbi:hypothetical protein C0J52_12178 [Blattella germanica]|nr:hypothetical protein C0J52_12178 [Blattella germanica]
MSGSNNSEETEDAISQFLEDLGLLEDGMTANDKRSLWEVIKLSKDTAQAEEQDRQKRARRTLQIDEVINYSVMYKQSEHYQLYNLTFNKNSREKLHNTVFKILCSYCVLLYYQRF